MSSMLSSPIQQIVKQQIRNVSKSSLVKGVYSSQAAAINPSLIKNGINFKVNNLERKLLVWTGKYMNSEQVPNSLPPSTMEHARNLVRIRITNWMMIVSAFGCITYVIINKNKAKLEESEQMMEDEFLRRINGKL